VCGDTRGYNKGLFTLFLCHNELCNKKIDAMNKDLLQIVQLSAQRGNAESQYALGACYSFGQGVPQDYKKAAKYFSLAAQQGHVLSQKKLGYYYLEGKGVEQSNQKAIKWFKLAAKQGNLAAIKELKKLGEDYSLNP